MIAYKLFRSRANGTVGPLFINRKHVVTFYQWMTAENHPTKGYAQRPGWHCGLLPQADHLSMKGRVWCPCELLGIEYTPATHPHLFSPQGDMKTLPVAGWYRWKRPSHQGGEWIIASHIKVLPPLSPYQVRGILEAHQEDRQSIIDAV